MVPQTKREGQCPSALPLTLTTFRKQRDNERREVIRARRAQPRQEASKTTTKGKKS